jgi:hypothetical protein
MTEQENGGFGTSLAKEKCFERNSVPWGRNSDIINAEIMRTWGKIMNIVKLSGNVDENRRLSAQVPASIRPEPLTVLVLPVSQENDEAQAWTAGVAREWADDLGDPDQDIYTLADGEPVREP